MGIRALAALLQHELFRGLSNIVNQDRHTSRCSCVGCVHVPQSLTYVSSWGYALLPPCYNTNYFED
ncbi:hypothetical protein PRCB_24775 [Pantoea rodasii]|uniref:Uncharacterized protein n=1 Tax=Pantoea rodasii TaxID=1076549 RepID=A0A2M9W4D6_9GAMM|nr:hypothetical protein PRCB_24775 [Pantoea rodasii]